MPPLGDDLAQPQVYLDTLGLIGAVPTRFEPGAGRLAFGLDAVAASFVFFFSLGYGARLLAPVMASPRVWRLLDAGIGIVMWLIAAGLIAHLHPLRPRRSPAGAAAL